MGPFGAVAGLFWNRSERRFRAPWRMLAALVLALLLLSIVASIGSALYGRYSPTGPDAVAAWELGLASAGLLVLTLAVVAISWFLDKRRIGDLGLRFDRQWWLDAGFGLALGAAMALVVVGLLLAAGARIPDVLVTRPGDFRLPAVSPLVGVVLFAALFGAFAVLEEVVIRGYLLVNVAEGLRGQAPSSAAAAWASVGLTALAFGGLHAANPSGTLLGMLVITGFGLFLGAAAVLTDGLAIPIGVHFAWNVTLGPVFGLPVSGLRTEVALVEVLPGDPVALTGGAFGPEGGVLALAGLAVGTGLLVVWLRARYGGLRVDESVTEPDIWDVRMPEP